jgi:hypothetical protein
MTGKNTMENSKKANGMQKYRLFFHWLCPLFYGGDYRVYAALETQACQGVGGSVSIKRI